MTELVKTKIPCYCNENDAALLHETVFNTLEY